MRVYLTCSNKAFDKNRKFALFMARCLGCFDKVVSYKLDKIDDSFYEEHENILSKKRGAGYWLWKPYFIYRTLTELNDGDFLFYSDAGAFILKNIGALIDQITVNDQDIMGFELPLIESQWTKKELFIRMNCNETNYTESNQIMASFCLIRKTSFSMSFFKEFLELACNEMNITDKYDDAVKQNPDFIDHRHDQSIFSLLYKKYKLRPFKDPSQLGQYPRGYSGCLDENLKKNELHRLSNGRLFRYYSYSEEYQNILFHNRKGKPLVSFIKFKIKEILYKLKLYKGLVS